MTGSRDMEEYQDIPPKAEHIVLPDEINEIDIGVTPQEADSMLRHVTIIVSSPSLTW
jgi:hypothetical protein